MLLAQASGVGVAHVVVAAHVVFRVALEALVDDFAETEGTTSNGNASLGVEFLAKRRATCV